MSAAEYNDPRLKFLPTRTSSRALLVLAVPIALLAVVSLPWTAERPPSPPRVVAVARATGPLAAGAAEVPFSLPAEVPIAGFARLSYASVGALEPTGVRAVLLAAPGCKVALVSAELLLVPEALAEDVRARVSDLHLDGVVLAATHTHAGAGGYWDSTFGARMATGPFDPKIRDAIVAAAAEAIRGAAGALAPARLSVGRGSADELARSRSGGDEDAPLTVLRLERADGTPIAELTVFAAHGTLLGKRNRAISGDWPGRFLADGRHGVRLLLQGAIGDQSAEGPASATPERFAAALAAHLDVLTYSTPDPAPPLAFAGVETGLPSLDPGGAPALLRRAARTLAAGALPATARVEALRIGPAVLVAVPAEPVARVGVRWRSALPDGAVIVSLADGYLGYVEAPERMAARAGETVRTYYGPALADTLGAAVSAAASATAAPRR